jgi:hypothetical protein
MTKEKTKIEEQEKCILVPYDFTDEANYAIDHALLLIKTENLPIHVLHIVKKKKHIDAAKIKLQTIVDDLKQRENLVKVNFVIAVRKGNLYKEIHKYGNMVNTYVAVMGTHGVKNIRKAMKVVKKFVKIPFILVQNPVVKTEYKNVLLPIGTDKSQRVKAQWVKYLNKLFRSMAFVINHDEKDTYKVRDLHRNLQFVQDIFEKENITYELKSGFTKKHFADHVYDYALEINADIILIMTHRYKYYTKQLRKAENIENSKHIPIMCVNKRTDINKLSNFG